LSGKLRRGVINSAMRFIRLLILLFFVFVFLFIILNPEYVNKTLAVMNGKFFKTVIYKEPFGQKYHREGCSDLDNEEGRIVEISLWRAKMRKLKPCQVCNP